MDLHIGVECLHVEHVEDAARHWWRWLVCGEKDPTKKERGVESIWRRRRERTFGGGGWSLVDRSP